MKVKILKSILALSLVLGLLSGMLIAAPMAAAAATTWDVYEGQSIQAAIDGASDGDTVFVHAGTYVLPMDDAGYSLCVGTPNITLKGEGADVVTLDGNEGSYAIDLGISSGSSHGGAPAPGCIVEGFTIVNSGIGINVEVDTPNCIIRNNVINQPYEAVCTYSSNTTIEGNLLSATDGDYGAVDIEEGEGSTVVNNTIDGGLGTGIAVYWSANNIIARNNITSYGEAGIELYEAGAGNRIYQNNFGGNGVPVTISDSTLPTVTYWDSPEPIAYTYNGATYTDYLGNYWGSAYAGSDANGNGIGDIPYTVPDSLGSDNYPLMGQYGVAITEPAPAPTAAFTSDVQSGTAPLTVHFTDQSTNSPTSWAWDFSNDGTVDSTVQNPSYIYAAGNYTVKLTATNGSGSGDVVKTDYIIVTVAGSSSSLTLNANVVLPVVGIQLDKSSINYGDIKPGHDSAVETVRVTNTGNVAADVTLQVQGNGTDAQSFYEQSLWVNSALYNSSTVLATIAETLYSDVATQLKVPSAWDKTGAQQAIFIFWAEESG